MCNLYNDIFSICVCAGGGVSVFFILQLPFVISYLTHEWAM